MKTKIFIASHNKNKIKEIKEILNLANIELVCPNDFDDFDDVEETGNNFKENAYIKAKYYFDKYHLPTISDDSGLCIDCLDGKPGIYSARYGGNDYVSVCNEFIKNCDQANNRKAYFNCTICFINNTSINYFEGIVNGEISHELKGDNGFGYDPIFYIKELGLTMAEMDSDTKNHYSHRYEAFKKLGDYINEKGL